MKIPLRYVMFFILPWMVNILNATEHEIPVVMFSVSSFNVLGENPLPEDLTQRILAPYLGEHEGLDGLLDATAELESRLLEAGHSFHRVILPPQTVDSGTINLEIVVFTLANLEVTGNQYFSEENIKASLPGLMPGQIPDTRALTRELAVANGHPAKQTTIRMKQSEAPNGIDVELVVEDQKPWQVFTSLNNQGHDETGNFRLSAGVQHSNITNHDDALTLSYTTSPGHFSEVKQFGANYQIPIYALSGIVYLYHSRSDVDSGRIEEVFDVSGAGRFSGVNYSHILMNIGNYRHRAKLGLEDRLFENNIDFEGTPLGVDVRSRPLSLSYSGEIRYERYNLNFDLSYAINISNGSNNNDTIYEQARSGADASWQVFRATINADYFMRNRWLLRAALNAQYTGEPLISGEQFGIGGASSVRGFDERAVAGDKGVSISIEAMSPPFLYNVNMYGFIDTGYVDKVNTDPGEIDDDMLVSVGSGIRWSMNNQLSLDLNYGHEINDSQATNVGGSKVNLNIFYRY